MTMTRDDARAMRESIQTLYTEAEQEYWDCHKKLDDSFSCRKTQMAVMAHQTRVYAAMVCLQDAKNAMTDIIHNSVKPEIKS